MEKINAKIIKRGNQWCLVSKDGTKNLGCFISKKAAEQRLRQIEYFKHSKGSYMNYNDFFNNFSKFIVDPKTIGQVVESKNLNLQTGTIANRASDRLLDRKDHFPVTTEVQARSSMVRVLQLTEVPDWYNGTIAELRKEIYDNILSFHPDLKLNVNVPVEQTIALSDGQSPAQTSLNNIKDPEDDRKKDLVPQVARPTITSAEFISATTNEQLRKTVAGQLLEMLDSQLAQMQIARNVAQRLMSNGISADEFEKLSVYIQQDVLSELLFKGTKASSEDRRRELLEKMTKGDK